MSQQRVAEPAAFERAHYLRTFGVANDGSLTGPGSYQAAFSNEPFN
jgi:hypothetical protein